MGEGQWHREAGCVSRVVRAPRPRYHPHAKSQKAKRGAGGSRPRAVHTGVTAKKSEKVLARRQPKEGYRGGVWSAQNPQKSHDEKSEITPLTLTPHTPRGPRAAGEAEAF